MGTQRIMAEFREMRSWDDSPQVDDLQLVQDCAARWRFKARNFDSSSDGGRDLNADLAQLLRKRGRDYIVMEVSFPKDYPTSPFSLRVVSPRMRWYTGHVSAGGSICIAALTTDGSPNAWRKTHNVESVLRTVFANMLYCDVGVIRTANGGGKTGPLRVDLEGRFGHDVLSEYSEHEASEGFRRMLDHHRRHGW
ncbi:hypothetical protein M885DRAFT_508169 [Pelagophyceae sp. CCMP2097]|nr:hypothetical protein M885DRAFT_508169 [Pelagophyceae sp. CCMP2097]